MTIELIKSNQKTQTNFFNKNSMHKLQDGAYRVWAELNAVTAHKVIEARAEIEAEHMATLRMRSEIQPETIGFILGSVRRRPVVMGCRINIWENPQPITEEDLVGIYAKRKKHDGLILVRTEGSL